MNDRAGPDIASDIAACRACADKLPFEPRPIFQLSATAPILIVGQAPGTKAHESGLTFDDASGDRLREWLDVTREQFYDPDNFAIAAMGFCYPGRTGSGDAPPRPECAALWRPQLAEYLAGVRLALLVGSYAQTYYLGRGTMTARVRGYRDYLPRYLPLPHPSWRTTLWIRRNPWFEEEVLPVLRARVHALLRETHHVRPSQN